MTSEEMQRVTRLEVEMEHLKEKMDDTHLKVVQLHEMALRARGAWWVIGGTATIASGVTAILFKVLPYFHAVAK